MVPDPFRTIPTRHIGHGFPVAEAFGDEPPSPVLLDLLTSLATGYIVLHALHRGLSVGGGPLLFTTFFDTLIFDGLASAIVPSFMAFHVRVIARSMCEEVKVPKVIQRWGPVVAGLAVVSITWRHVDRMVDEFMNQTIRTLY